MSISEHTFRVEINNVDITNDVKDKTLSFTEAIGGYIPQAEFTVMDISQSYTFSGWEEVEVYLDFGLGGQTQIFGGYVIKAAPQRVTTTQRVWRIQARGYALRLAKALPVIKTYLGKTPGYIIDDIFTRADLGDFDTSSLVTAGSALDKFAVRWQEPLIDLIDRLALYAGEWQWYITAEKKLYFGAPSSNAAPISLTDDSTLIDTGIYKAIVAKSLTVDPDASQKLNRITVVGGQAATGPVTDNYTGSGDADAHTNGDGSVSFNLSHQDLSAFSSITVAGTEYIDEMGFDWVDAYSGSIKVLIDKVAGTARFDTGIVGASDAVAITYRYFTPIKEMVIDSGSYTTLGFYLTAPNVNVPGISTEDMANDYGQAQLDASGEALNGSCETWYFGVRAGHWLIITSTLYGLSGAYQVSKVTMQASRSGVVETQVHFGTQTGTLSSRVSGGRGGNAVSSLPPYYGSGTFLEDGDVGVLRVRESINVGNATDYLTGAGIWQGMDSGVAKQHIGDPAGDHLKWDGTDLIITGKFIGASDISGTDAATFTINEDVNTATSALVFGASGGSATINWDGSDLQSEVPVIIDVTDAEAFLVRKDIDGGDVFVVDTANSRVGINVNPGYPFHVDTGSFELLYQDNPGLGIKNTLSSGGWARGFSLADSSLVEYVIFGAFGSGQTLSYAFIGEAYDDTWMRFYPTTMDVVVPQGNLGVGPDTTPDYKLDVQGTFRADGAASLGSTLDVAGATGIDGDFDIATNKFTVASATGNANVAGTLNVTGVVTTTTDLDVGATLTTSDVGSSLIPESTDTYDLGSATKLWRKGWLSELESILFVENSVQVTGGWWMVPHQSGTLNTGINTTITTIVIDAGHLEEDDFLIFRGNLQVEYMQVTSDDTNHPSYTVTRNVDGSGGNTWPAGHVFVNLGYNGDGRIEFDAQTGGPRISVFRQGTSYNAQTEYVRIGDLDDTYGYAVETYGIGIGAYGVGNYLTVDATDGLQFYNASHTQLAQLSGSTWTLGNTGAEHIKITSSAFQIIDNATVYTDLSAGYLTLGEAAKAHIIMAPTGFGFYDENGAIKGSLTSTAWTLGATGAEHLTITSSGVQLFDGATEYAKFAATTTIGNTAGGEYLSLSSSYIQMFGGGTERHRIASDGSGWLAGSDKLAWDTSGDITMTGSVTLTGGSGLHTLTDYDGNLVTPQDWELGVVPTSGAWDDYGTPGENDCIMGDGPWGDRRLLREATASGGGQDGGIAQSNSFSVDPTKTYRILIFIKRTNNQGSGATYLGLTNGAGQVKNIVTDAEDTSPYMWSGDLPALDTWYLAVGYIYNHDHVGTTIYGGLYNVETGEKVLSPAKSFKWYDTNVSDARIRAFQYGCAAGTITYFTYPRVDIINGSEPSIQALMNSDALLNMNGPISLIGKAQVTSAPSGAGLYIDSTHMGYYTGSAWQTYMDNSGLFYLTGADASTYFQWTPATNTLEAAGWTFNPAYLAKDTGIHATSAGMAPADWPFYAGATYASRASADFRVYRDGSLTATNATITGAITADTGYIGGSATGWTIAAGYFNSGDMKFDSVNKRIYFDGSTYIWSHSAGHIGINGALNISDTLTVSGASIATVTLTATGSISSSGGDVGTTSGSLFCTDFNTFKVDSSGNLTITVDKFTVAGATGNTVIAGTLDAQGDISNSTGSLTLDDAVIVTGILYARNTIRSDVGSVTIQDNAVITGTIDAQDDISNSTGNVSISDTLAITGNLYINSNKFQVFATSGNTYAAGFVDAAAGFKDNGVAGIDKSWTVAAGDVVTISGGIITAVV